MKRFSVLDAQRRKHIVLVDDCDANLLRNYVFRVTGRSGAYSVARTGAGNMTEPLSHCILKRSGEGRVLHINGNGLDNQRANLLPATPEQWLLYFNACGNDAREAKRTGEPCNVRRLGVLRDIIESNKEAA